MQQAQQSAYLQANAQNYQQNMQAQMYDLHDQTNLSWMAQMNANSPHQQRAVRKAVNEIVDQHEKYERAIDVLWNKILSAVFTAKEIASETYWVLCYRQRLAEPVVASSPTLALRNVLYRAPAFENSMLPASYYNIYD